MDTNGSKTNWMETSAGQQLQERLNSEKTLQSLDHLLERIGTLEEGVERLTTLLERGPGMLSMAADMADETYRASEERGIILEERLKGALQLAERLTAPSMVQKLEQLFELVDMAPDTLKMAQDMSADVMDRLENATVSPARRLEAALQLAERLTDPILVKRLDQLLPMLEMAPDAFEMLTAMAQDVMEEAQAEGIHPAERLSAVMRLVNQLTEPRTIESLEQLLQLTHQLPGLTAMAVDVVDEEVRESFDVESNAKALLEVGSSAVQAVTEARQEPGKRMGAWGLFRALSDKDRQVAMGFLMKFLKQFGQHLRGKAAQ